MDAQKIYAENKKNYHALNDMKDDVFYQDDALQKEGVNQMKKDITAEFEKIDNKYDQNKKSELINLIINLFEGIAPYLCTGMGSEQFINLKGNLIEKEGSPYIYVTLDAYYAQIMFKTRNGFSRFILFPKEIIDVDNKQKISTIYYRLSNNLTGQLTDNDIDNYNMVIKDDVDKGRYKMANVLQYMVSFYKINKAPFIAMLGKARFWIDGSKAKIIKNKFTEIYEKDKENVNYTVLLAEKSTREIFSQLLFLKCNIGFISGGYRGIKYSDYGGYGITRSGYELAKYYEKPVVTIMCNAGLPDSHENSDAKGLYGMHWGDDTPALTLMADCGIFIAPFGAWTDIELALFIHRKKPAVIFFPRELMSNQFDENEDIAKYTQKLHNFGYGPVDTNAIIDMNKKINDNDKSLNENDRIQGIVGYWIPHFGHDSIPIMNNEKNIAKYIMKHYNQPQMFTDRAEAIENVLEQNKIKLLDDLTLNRNLMYRLNDFLGIYENVNIKKDPLMQKIP